MISNVSRECDGAKGNDRTLLALWFVCLMSFSGRLISWHRKVRKQVMKTDAGDCSRSIEQAVALSRAELRLTRQENT